MFLFCLGLIWFGIGGTWVCIGEASEQLGGVIPGWCVKGIGDILFVLGGERQELQVSEVPMR